MKTISSGFQFHPSSTIYYGPWEEMPRRHWRYRQNHCHLLEDLRDCLCRIQTTIPKREISVQASNSSIKPYTRPHFEVTHGLSKLSLAREEHVYAPVENKGATEAVVLPMCVVRRLRCGTLRPAIPFQSDVGLEG